MGVEKNFYDRDYFENGIASGKSGYNGYAYSDGQLILANELKKYFAPTKVLDVGCAKGFLVYALRSKGIEAYGVEVSEYACEHSHPGAKEFIFNTSITSYGATFPEVLKGTDLVVCYDILEHLDDEELNKALTFFSSILKAKFVTMKCPFEVYDWDADKSHINIKPQHEWINLFKKFNYEEFIPNTPKRPWSFWDNRTLCFKIC